MELIIERQLRGNQLGAVTACVSVLNRAMDEE